MKRLVTVPLAALCACTITVSPLHKAQKRTKHRTSKSSQKASPKPSPKPAINQLHEQYRPIYEKLPPPPTVPPEP